MLAMEEDAGPFVAEQWDFPILGPELSSHSKGPGCASRQMSYHVQLACSEHQASPHKAVGAQESGFQGF